ncbi:unnamed protein product [Effrenium voratum]|nr:unnamed protein product [Effrenium voratum]
MEKKGVVVQRGRIGLEGVATSSEMTAVNIAARRNSQVVSQARRKKGRRASVEFLASGLLLQDERTPSKMRRDLEEERAPTKGSMASLSSSRKERQLQREQLVLHMFRMKALEEYLDTPKPRRCCNFTACMAWLASPCLWLGRRMKLLHWSVAASCNRPEAEPPEEFRRRRMVGLWSYLDSSGWYVASLQFRKPAESAGGFQLPHFEEPSPEPKRRTRLDVGSDGSGFQPGWEMSVIAGVMLWDKRTGCKAVPKTRVPSGRGRHLTSIKEISPLASPATERMLTRCCALLRGGLRWLLLRLSASLASCAAALPPATPNEAASTRRQMSEVRQMLAGAEAACQVVAIPHGPKPIRIFIDGVFDLTHYGHVNAFRQARALGQHLVVGVNSDDSVLEAKGFLPVLLDTERQQAVSACRFVDQIVPASPYIMTESYIDELVEQQGIDYFVHGDDPCIVDGRDVYESARKAGRFCTIPRTEGISTTDIVGRLLLLTQDHHTDLFNEPSSSKRPPEGVFASQQSNFLVTSQLLRAFSGALPGALSAGCANRKVIYVDGAWDMFHCGHVSLLRKAKSLGDLLIVGVHADAAVNRHRGSNYPIMNMQERVLSVLGCRYVDDVLLDAPWQVTREMIATLRISAVVRGTVCDTAREADDPHAVPKAMGIHQELQSEEPLSLEVITERLSTRRAEVQTRQRSKASQEEQWYRNKHGLTP